MARIIKCTTPNCKCKIRFSFPEWEDVKNKSSFYNACGGNNGDNPSNLGSYDLVELSHGLAPQFNFKHNTIIGLVHPALQEDIENLSALVHVNTYWLNKPMTMTELGYVGNIRLMIYPEFENINFHYEHGSASDKIIYPIVIFNSKDKVYEVEDITVIRCTKG